MDAKARKDKFAGLPLTLGEARLVAAQIRESGSPRSEYWAWVIETLCERLEGLDKEEK